MKSNTIISPNFSLREVERSQTAQRRKIDNNLPETLLPSVRAVAENILEPIRDHFSIAFSPNSWYRSRKLNKAIGGSRKSQHILGEAVDIEIPGKSNYGLAKWISKNLQYDQIILEFWNEANPNSGWVHVSHTINRKNRKRFLIYDGKKFKEAA